LIERIKKEIPPREEKTNPQRSGYFATEASSTTFCHPSPPKTDGRLAMSWTTPVSYHLHPCEHDEGKWVHTHTHTVHKKFFMMQ
jgi:hypothetical protein